MMRRQEGYVTEVNFTNNFWTEMSPCTMDFVLRQMNFQTININNSISYIDLACGQGFITNLLAASNPNYNFVGIDISAAHIFNAQKMAREASLKNIEFREESFEDSAKTTKKEIRSADIISFNSIYSWISEKNKNEIGNFIKSKMNPGGIAYVSYNSMPGWAGLEPIRQMIYEYCMRKNGNVTSIIKDAIIFINNMSNSDLMYFKRNKYLKSILKEVSNKSPEYLVHEYLQDVWKPLYVTEVAQDMEKLNLNFVGSADPIENFPEFFMSTKSMELMECVSDKVMAELIKDFSCNQWYRRELYSKGLNKLNNISTMKRFDDLKFTNLCDPDEMNFKYDSLIGTINIEFKNCKNVVDTVLKGCGSFEDIQNAVGGDIDVALKTISALFSTGYIHPCRDSFNPEPASRLNRVIAEKVRQGESYRYIAVPMIGSAMKADDIEIIAIDLLLEGKGETEEQLASGIYEAFFENGRYIARFGGILEKYEVNLEEIRDCVKYIFHKKVPIWRKLGII